MSVESKHTETSPEMRQRILIAAKREFAQKGLNAARLEDIARQADTTKRYIYMLFHSREQLFKEVVETSYLQFSDEIAALDLQSLPPKEALAKIVRTVWAHYLEHPELLNLVNSENLHEARHIKDSSKIRESGRGSVEVLHEVINRGVATGEFRDDVNVTQLSITLLAINYYYLNNRHTGQVLYGRDYLEPESLEERINFNVDTILRMVVR